MTIIYGYFPDIYLKFLITQLFLKIFPKYRKNFLKIVCFKSFLTVSLNFHRIFRTHVNFLRISEYIQISSKLLNPYYFYKFSVIILEIFQNLSRNFLKWFLKFSGKIFMQRASLAITLWIPPPTPLAAMVIWVRALENIAPAPHHHNHFHHYRHPCATSLPHPATPTSTTVAFFVMLWFSNLVPYVAILKMFHVKKLQIKVFRHRISYKKIREGICLPPSGVEPWGSKDDMVEILNCTETEKIS